MMHQYIIQNGSSGDDFRIWRHLICSQCYQSKLDQLHISMAHVG